MGWHIKCKRIVPNLEITMQSDSQADSSNWMGTYGWKKGKEIASTLRVKPDLLRIEQYGATARSIRTASALASSMTQCQTQTRNNWQASKIRQIVEIQQLLFLLRKYLKLWTKVRFLHSMRCTWSKHLAFYILFEKIEICRKILRFLGNWTQFHSLLAMNSSYITYCFEMSPIFGPSEKKITSTNNKLNDI